MFLDCLFLVYCELFLAIMNLMLLNCISAIFLNTVKYNNSARITSMSWSF